MADVFGGAAGAAGGYAQGGTWGAAAGALGGLFGKGGTRSERELRPFDPFEQQLYGNVMSGLGGLTGPGAQNKYFEGLWNPMEKSMEGMFAKERGRAMFDLDKTGGGPSSIRTSQLGELGSQHALSLSRARGETQGLASQLQRGDISSLMGLYSGLRGAQQYGGASTTTQPGAGAAAGLGMFGSAMRDPQSYWRTQGPGKG